MGKDVEYAVSSLLQSTLIAVQDEDVQESLRLTMRQAAEELVAFFYTQCDCIVHRGKAYRAGSHQKLINAILRDAKSCEGAVELAMLNISNR